VSLNNRAGLCYHESSLNEQVVERAGSFTTLDLRWSPYMCIMISLEIFSKVFHSLVTSVTPTKDPVILCQLQRTIMFLILVSLQFQRRL
jgi:hypothetical protein